MPYIVRDQNGNLAGVYNQPVEGGEEIDSDNAELQDFLLHTAPSPMSNEWLKADLALVRVMEDLVDVLIDKNVVNFTDFPDAAQKKLLERRGKRKEFAYVADLFGAPEQGAAEDDEDAGFL